MPDRISLVGVVIVSVVVVFADCALTFMLFTQKIPPENKELANIMFGGINLALGMIIQYWIGTSRSSNAKDVTIADLARKGP